MRKLYLLKGLPGSGKSTWAKEQVKNSNGKIKRVNKDDLRHMIDAGIWSKKNEKLILKAQWDMVYSWLYTGFDVIVDNTNFHPSHLKDATEIINTLNNIFRDEFNVDVYSLEVKFFDTPLEECIRRDSLRPNPVGKNVIMQMYNQYLKPEPPKYNPDLPDCIICDIDGTLADKGDRSPFDESKVMDDEIIWPVAKVIKSLMHEYGEPNYDTELIIFSGRTEECREDTERWLNKYLREKYTLYMRKVGDNRSDDIIKRELYEQHIKDKFNVSMVFDDRLRVVRLWYQLGLFCLCVNQGLIEF